MYPINETFLLQHVGVLESSVIYAHLRFSVNISTIIQMKYHICKQLQFVKRILKMTSRGKLPSQENLTIGGVTPTHDISPSSHFKLLVTPLVAQLDRNCLHLKERILLLKETLQIDDRTLSDMKLHDLSEFQHYWTKPGSNFGSPEGLPTGFSAKRKKNAKS